MGEGGSNSIINLGDLSKPATVLIEKISDAIGGIARPGQIRRIAKAEADADLIKAEARVKITELEERALIRMVREEGQKQENIENITARAIPHLSQDAKPENVQRDWLTNFFDRCRLTSDEQMQELWASILSGEANKPGAFSKRTIEIVSTLSKQDADLFTKLCTFAWMIGNVTPVILDSQNAIYNNAGINFNSLLHLEDIGLVKFQNLSGFIRKVSDKYVSIFYYGRPLTIEFPDDKPHIEIGKVLLTQAGQELASICSSAQSEDYYSYVISEWQKGGYILSSPILKKKAA